MNIRTLLFTCTPILLGIYLFYYMPVFLNENNFMYFIEPAPRFSPIGIDLRWLHSIIQEWHQNGFFYKPGLTLHFPPLLLLLFSWINIFDFCQLYKIYVSLMFLLYFAFGFGFVLFLQKKYNYSNESVILSLAFLFLGAFSYGLQFEIERGQWNLIAFFFVVIGIMLVKENSAKKYKKYIGYGALIIASQIKIWPLIYIMPFIYCESTFQRKIKYLLSFLILNTALLYIFGAQGANEFIHNISRLSGEKNLGPAQTSLAAFLWCIKNEHFYFEEYFSIFAIISIAIIFFHVLFTTFFGRKNNLETLIFLCTLLGLLIPAHGNDYKLSLLPLNLVFLIPFFCSRIGKSISSDFLISLIIFFVFITFFSFSVRPKNVLLQNTVFSLLLSGMSVCFLYIKDRRQIYI